MAMTDMPDATDNIYVDRTGLVYQLVRDGTVERLSLFLYPPVAYRPLPGIKVDAYLHYR